MWKKMYGTLRLEPLLGDCLHLHRSCISIPFCLPIRFFVHSDLRLFFHSQILVFRFIPTAILHKRTRGTCILVVSKSIAQYRRGNLLFCIAYIVFAGLAIVIVYCTTLSKPQKFLNLLKDRRNRDQL